MFAADPLAISCVKQNNQRVIKMKNKKKRDRKKKRLFRRFFGYSALTVLAGFVFIGFFTMFLTASEWWTDKVDTLTRNAKNISSTYAELVVMDIDDESINEIASTSLNFVYKATLSEYFIADLNGKIIYCCGIDDNGDNVCDKHTDFEISKEHMQRAIDGGFTDYTTQDEFGIGNFVVAVPIKNGDETIAVCFAIEDAITGFLPYVAGIVQATSYAILGTLIVIFIVMYFITRSITKPLSEMQEVTGHYAKGEFQYRADESYKMKDFSDFAKALNKMAYELKINEDAQKSFVANVSHELKTPMTSIGGFIDGVLDGTIPPEEEKKYLQVVSSEVKRLSRMVVSMLNLSKIEAGEVQISPREYDISKQILEIFLSFERRIDEKKIEIVGFEEMGEVKINADKDLIQQVIYNLIDNAVKFTPDGGTIRVFAQHKDDSTYVGIRNSGAGVSEDEISRIFERFYKVDKSRSYDVKGVGLGLYIVKTIINMHDGEIFAESKQGEYTQFSFEIPD